MMKLESPPPDHCDWFYVPKRQMILNWIELSVYRMGNPDSTPQPLKLMEPPHWTDGMDALIQTYDLVFHREFRHAASTDGLSYWTWVVGKDKFSRYVSTPMERHYWKEVIGRYGVGSRTI